MRRIWMVVVALTGVVLVTDARADMVYLTNGQSIWGREAYEEGDSVVVERPGGDLRIPKSQVDRIERTQSTLPPFYSSPQTAPAGAPSPPPPPGGGTTQLPPPAPPPSPGK
jgi:hypothetical protein